MHSRIIPLCSVFLGFFVSCLGHARELDTAATTLSGKFNSRGVRAEESPAKNVFRGPTPALTAAELEAHVQSCKTIDEWARLAAKARSMQFRYEATATLLAIARRTERDRKPSDVSLTEKEADDLRQACLRLMGEPNEGSAGVRTQILDSLLHLANKDCIATFNRMIDDRQNSVSDRAFAGIEKVGDETSVRVLQAYLMKDPAKIRSNFGQAFKSLGSLRTAAAREALEDIYTKSPLSEYKEAAGYQLDVLDATK